MSVASRLSPIRQFRGIEAADLAKRAGVSRQTIYAIESSSYVPNPTVALRLARELRELEVSFEDLTGAVTLAAGAQHVQRKDQRSMAGTRREIAGRAAADVIVIPAPIRGGRAAPPRS